MGGKRKGGEENQFLGNQMHMDLGGVRNLVYSFSTENAIGVENKSK